VDLPWLPAGPLPLLDGLSAQATRVTEEHNSEGIRHFNNPCFI